MESILQTFLWENLICFHFWLRFWTFCPASMLFFYFSTKVLPRPPAEGSREALLRTYHGDADGVVKLVHEDADDSRGQQQQDQRVFELHTERASQTTENIFPLGPTPVLRSTSCI